MVERPASNGISWTTLISAVGLGFVIVGALWTIVQVQFAAIEKEKEIIRQELVKSGEEVRDQFKRVEDSFDRRRALNVEQVEFRQFELRILNDINVLKEQLRVLEQTRPTTGELSGTAKALEGRIVSQEDRLHSLELRLIPQAPSR
jgi:predicted phage gp36 major capsid-like protein